MFMPPNTMQQLAENGHVYESSDSLPKVSGLAYASCLAAAVFAHAGAGPQQGLSTGYLQLASFAWLSL